MRQIVLFGLLLFLNVSGVAAQDRQIWVRVEDPSGATIPGAQVMVLGGADMLADTRADAKGLALIKLGMHREIHIIVTAEGFATTEQDATIPARGGPDQIVVRLPLARVEDNVTVSATNEESGGLTQTLSQEEIDALPDDPDELQRMLEEIAGPGATIRVDGFTGGRLPTRDQIARIVVRRDAFSAEFHQVGQGRVEIATRPGVERWRGNAGMTVRPSGLSARDAVARSAKSGTLLRMNANFAGPLVRNRISISGDISGSSSEDTRGISALLPSGRFTAALKQPNDNREVSVRTEGLLTKTTMFRLSYNRSQSERDNQGISELDMPERGYRSENVGHEVRFSLEGGQRRPYHLRLQMDKSINTAYPDLVARTVIVQSAFREGGASVTGSDRGLSSVIDTMFTLVSRPYTLRVGSLVTYDHNEQGQLRNSLGTFTFTDIDSYLANRPATYTQRINAQPLGFGITQGATFIQYEAVKRGWNIGAGVRHEFQSGISDWTAFAPRFGLSRPLRRNNQTNFRAGYGWFYGWMPARIEEETIRLAQGSTEEEVIIRDPGYPDPFGAGLLTTRRDPPTRLTLWDGAELPRWQRSSVGIDHQIRPGMRLNVDAFYERSDNEFRSIDLNAPVAGVRPDATFGRMLLVQSIGRAERSGFNIDLSFSRPQRFFSNIRYGYSRNMNDADDALTPPPTGTFETEWASARGDMRHRLNWNLGLPIPRWGLNASFNGRLNSGSTYNMTTGRDDNGDALFNDRRPGVARNSLRGTFTTNSDFRLSWSFQSTPRQAGSLTAPAAPGRTAFNAQRGLGGGGGPRGPGGPGGRGPGGPNQGGRRFELYLFVSNLFNRVNRTGFVGQENSPLFMTPTSAQAARRMEMGWRFSF